MKELLRVMRKLIKISICLTILLQGYTVFASTLGKPTRRIHHRNGQRRLMDVSDRSGYINIDCGATKPYRKFNISYDSDERYIATGISMPIHSEYLLHDPVLNTVRSFPDGERNCYTVKPANGTDSNYLIRARFMYGDYDGKNSTPTFDIYIGVNYWETIVLQSAMSRVFIETLHKPTTEFIYFCLVNTGGGIPFVSELVLRPMDNSLYHISKYASLSTYVRYNTGIAVEDPGYNSYPDDIYDRFWSPLPRSNFQHWATYSTNKDLSSLKNDAYRLPPSIFKREAKPQAGNHSLNFLFSPGDPLQEFYFYLHFAETQKIGDNESRELSISIDGNPISKPIKLRYLEALTLASSPVKLGLGYSRIWLSISQTKTSTLPPILNALEVYSVIKLRQSATNQDDTNGIMGVKAKYGGSGLMRSWQGDPCLPKLPWDGLKCSNNGSYSPRIISLNLAFKGLSGEILPSLFSLKSLNYLNLSSNNLTGTIPEFLGDMPSLTVIDLSGNKLGGSVPITLTNRAKSGFLTLRLEGNPDLCTSGVCKEPRKKHKILIPVAVAASLFVLLIASACAVVCICRRKKKAGYDRRQSTQHKELNNWVESPSNF